MVAEPDAPSRAPARRRTLVVSVALVAVVAALLDVVETRRGAGIGDDAAGYIGVARALIHGHGLRSPVGTFGHHAFTLDPPGYPVLLATARAVGLDPYSWARWVGVGLAVGIPVLAAQIVWRATRSPLAAVAGAAVVGLSVDVLGLTSGAGSDALALAGTLAFVLAATWSVRFHPRAVIAAAVALVLVIATRFAGAALVPAAWLLLATSPAPRRDRIRAAIVLTGAAAATIALVGHSRRHGLGFHLSVAVHSIIGIRRSWPLRLLHFVPVAGYLAIVVLVVAAVAAVVIALLPARWCPPVAGAVVPTLRTPVARLLAAIAVCHAALVFAVTLLLQPIVEFSARIHLPASVSMALLVTLALTDILRLVVVPRWAAVAAGVALAALTLGPSVAQAIDAPRRHSIAGYQSSVWDPQRAALAPLRNVPTDVPIISDSAALVYFVTGRDVVRVPSRLDPEVQTPDPDYDAERAGTLHLLGGRAVVVGVRRAASTDPVDPYAEGLELVVDRDGVRIWATPGALDALR